MVGNQTTIHIISFFLQRDFILVELVIFECKEKEKFNIVLCMTHLLQPPVKQ